MTEIYGNLHICGNILTSRNYSFFVLKCSNCESTFEQWSSFLEHLKEEHSLCEADDEPACTNYHKDSIYNWECALDKADERLSEQPVFVDEGHSIFIPTKEYVTLDHEEYPTGIGHNECPNCDDEYCNEKKEYCSESKNLHSSIDGIESLKKFKFDLNDSEYRAMSLDFLRITGRHRMLWDPQESHGKGSSRRTAVENKVVFFFKNKGIAIDNNVMHSTIAIIMRKYISAVHEKKTSPNISMDTKLLLKNGAFLNNIIKARNKTENSCDDIEDTTFENDIDDMADDDSMTKLQNRIMFSERHPLVDDFIDQYRNNAVLWDTSLQNYNNRSERKKILNNWRDLFKMKYNIQFTYEELSYSLQEFRRIYFKNVQRRLANGELDEMGRFIVEQGSFLPPRPTIKHKKCKYCDKNFHQEHTLQRHIYAEHGIGEMPFKCSFCDSRFEDHLVHRRHEQRYHYKDYRHICEHCQKAFFTRDELERHLVIHTGEKKFVCELCGRSFAKKTNLRNHDIRVHLRQRNFACSLCPKAFYTNRLLKDHMNVHLNIRDRICPTCGKGFTSHHSLIRHKQIHSEVKRYACKLCNARFHQFVGLNSHLKNTHKYVRSKNETASDDEDKSPISSK